jgi:hypothetical protein
MDGSKERLEQIETSLYAGIVGLDDAVYLQELVRAQATALAAKDAELKACEHSNHMTQADLCKMSAIVAAKDVEIERLRNALVQVEILTDDRLVCSIAQSTLSQKGGE